MKKLLLLLTAFVSLLNFSSCRKDEVLTKNELVEKSNPFNYLGELHNKGMHAFKEKINNNKTSNINDLNNFVVEFMFSEIKKKYDISNTESLIKNVKGIVSANRDIKSKFINSSKLNEAFIEEMIDSSKISDFQKKNLKSIFTALDEPESAKSNLLKIETKVLNSNVSNSEKFPLLVVLAISKASYDFWTSNKEFFIQTKGATVSGALKSDAAGAVEGVLWSVVSGASETGLVFGPGGMVLTAAAAGFTDGLWASACYLGIWSWF